MKQKIYFFLTLFIILIQASGYAQCPTLSFGTDQPFCISKGDCARQDICIQEDFSGSQSEVPCEIRYLTEVSIWNIPNSGLGQLSILANRPQFVPKAFAAKFNFLNPYNGESFLTFGYEDVAEKVNNKVYIPYTKVLIYYESPKLGTCISVVTFGQEFIPLGVGNSSHFTVEPYTTGTVEDILGNNFEVIYGNVPNLSGTPNNTDCESEANIAIILDESGSIDNTEASQIRQGLTNFINAELNSNMTISLIGMSNNDENLRRDPILEKKVTTSTLSNFQTWISRYRSGYNGTPGITPSSDFWASGLQVVLQNLTETPDIIIVITDGSQAKSIATLKNRMQQVNQISHVYVYGINTNNYVVPSNVTVPIDVEDGDPILEEEILASKSQLPPDYDYDNYIAAKSSLSTSFAFGTLYNSLNYLLGRAPLSSQTDILNNDYYAYTSFKTLGVGLSNLSQTLKESGIGCHKNNFCNSLYPEDEYPKVGDLEPNGAHIKWYLSAIGGEPLALDEELIDEAYEPGGASYWWDDITDTILTRTATSVYVDLGIIGSPDDDYQEFTISENATIADLQPSGPNIQWFLTPTGGVPLSSTTLLVDGTTYYAQEIGGVECRLQVDVFIGVLSPTGYALQHVCSGSTLANLEVTLIDNTHTLVWYDSEIDGNQLPLTTALVNNTAYYAAQKDSAGNESRFRLSVFVFVSVVEPPELPFSPQTLYADPYNPPTIANLIAFGSNIEWFASELEEAPLDLNTELIDQQTYYAQQTVNGCTSTRVPLQVILDPNAGPALLGCERFKPQFGDRYVINAWVKEQTVKKINPEVVPFNNSDFSASFVKLLNHLKDRMLSVDPHTLDIPKEYIPTSENLNFDDLVPFIKNTSVEERRLTVYNFKRIKESDYNRTIGFEFWLNKTDRGKPTNKIVYMSPKVKRTKADGTIEVQAYHYPLLDNIGYHNLTFKDVIVSGNTLKIISDFFTNEDVVPYQENYNEEYNNPISAILGQFTFFDYEDIPGYQPMTYANSMVELEYLDEGKNLIEIDDSYIQFKPQGEIIDGWQRITADFVIPLNAAKMSIKLKNQNLVGTDDAPGNLVYFDDIRMHPYNGNMKSFVYDPITQRLTAELDENNYATFYEYDEEGGLIRIKKETEKGIYTIQETRSNTLKN